MRTLTLLLATLLAAPALADWGDHDYMEEREMTLSVAGVDELVIEAGAGTLKVKGEPGVEAIRVHATILVDGADGDEAREFMSRRMKLSLERAGDSAVLVSDFQNGGMNRGSRSGDIALEVVMPQGMALDVDDGSGSIVLEDMLGDLRLDDGSGSIVIRGAASVDLDDGSGSIRISDVTGDVRVDDGSGSVTIVGVGGSVSVDDASGSINFDDVAGDFRVIDDGSGSVNFSNVLGQVDVRD